MHAHTQQLLSLRDGEPVDAQAARHVAECPSCLQALERLRHMQSQLRSLPVRQAPAGTWHSIQADLEYRTGRKVAVWQRVRFAAAAAGCIGLALMAALRFAGGEQHKTPHAGVNAEPVPALVETPPLPPATVEQLVAQSRQLEDVLRNLPERRVERVVLAATTDILEQRIQWLDFQLSFEPEAALSQEQARRLWRERVDLMDSLVKVRYAQAQDLAF